MAQGDSSSLLAIIGSVAQGCRAFREEMIGRHHTDSSTPKKPEKYGVSTRDGEPQLIFRRC